MQKLFVLMYSIFLILGGMVACTSQSASDNKEGVLNQSDKEENKKQSGAIEYYEFDTNVQFTIKDIEKPFSKSEVHLKPQAGEDYPKLHGIEAQAYELIDGSFFIHVFKNEEDLKKGLNQISDAYNLTEWGLKAYEVNNMLFIYNPAHATKELADKNHEKIKEAVNEMISGRVVLK